ncbi:MAG TPA: hypothetical protein VGO93_13245 [Candidatus Xenobia bacterium]
MAALNDSLGAAMPDLLQGEGPAGGFAAAWRAWLDLATPHAAVSVLHKSCIKTRMLEGVASNFL